MSRTHPRTISGSQLAPRRHVPAPIVTAGSRPSRAQRGAIGIMFTLLLVIVLGFIGLAIDMGRMYNRKIELQNVANAAALAAAGQLVGTSAGITNALTKAASVTNSLHYQYDNFPLLWSNAAIRFSASATAPDSDWMDEAAARVNPSGLFFARVDTSGLSVDFTVLKTSFMQIVSPAFASVTIRGVATAGRSSIKVTPLAICAMSNTPAVARSNPGPPANVELEEFGFRRGVAYDLMQLNPNGTAADNFVINPIDPIGSLGSSSNTSASVVAPFACVGILQMPRVMGRPISVARPFPIGELAAHLNSRFDDYSGGVCNPNGAPPDANIKTFTFSAVNWMSSTPGLPAAQSAQSTTVRGKLENITALSVPDSATNTAPMYGPLWSFSKAVPYSAYTAGVPEPSTGYVPFTTGAWATLYSPGKPVASALYPSSTPYQAASGANFLAPSAANAPGIRLRRVLNVPLLACPVGAGTNVLATVLGIGKFFMTVPATSTKIYAEFAGVVPEQSLGGTVELQ